VKVLICGGRDFEGAEFLGRVLEGLNISSLLHGGARGADRLAGLWAKGKGIPVEVWEAEWEEYGKAAGALRNERMLREGEPDLVVAFEGGRGTEDMVRRARRAGVPVLQPRVV
jgi:hypothetical protein